MGLLTRYRLVYRVDSRVFGNRLFELLGLRSVLRGARHFHILPQVGANDRLTVTPHCLKDTPNSGRLLFLNLFLELGRKLETPLWVRIINNFGLGILCLLLTLYYLLLDLIHGVT